MLSLKRRVRNFFEKYGLELFIVICISPILGVYGWQLCVQIKNVYKWVICHPYVCDILSNFFYIELSLFALLLIIVIHGKYIKLIVGIRIANVLVIILILGVMIYSLIGTLIYSVVSFTSLTDWIYLIFLLILLLYIVYVFCKNNTFFIYSPERYVLYLRSFKFDGSDFEIEDEIRNIHRNYSVFYDECDVLTIANPKTFLSRSIGHTFYLPASNWKLFVTYYLERAEKVILVMGDTDGIMWEILHHVNYLYKFILIIPDREKSLEIIHNLEADSPARKFLQESIQNVELNKFVISFSNNGPYVTRIKDMKRHVFKKQNSIQPYQNMKDNDLNAYVKIIKKLDSIRSVKRGLYDIIEVIIYWAGEVYEVIEDFFSMNWIYLLLSILGGGGLAICGVVLCILSFPDIWLMILAILMLGWGVCIIVIGFQKYWY